jgi:hypothetical protein
MAIGLLKNSLNYSVVLDSIQLGPAEDFEIMNFASGACPSS